MAGRGVPAWRGVLLVTLAMAVLGCTGGARGSTDEPRRIGILRAVPDDDHASFVEELRTQGFVLGRDVVIRPTAGETVEADVEAARRTLRSWLSEGLDLVIAYSTPFSRVAIEEAPGVPILVVVNDPVASGLIDDRDAPAGPASGVTFRAPADRTLDLARRALPELTTVGYLAPATDPGVPGHRAAARAAAAQLGLAWVEASFSEASELSEAVAELAAAGADVVYPTNSNTTIGLAAELAAELEQHGLPAVGNSDFLHFAVVVVTPEGGELRRQLARQAARLLDGAAIATVPVEDPRKFTVIVNRTQLRRLGLPEPPVDVVREADVVR